MKHLLALIAFLPFGSTAQDLSNCERLMDYQYYLIDSLPSSKIEIYHKAHLLLATWYPGYPSIVQIADSNSGIILVSGTNSIEVPTGYKKQTVLRPYNHRIKIECRDGRLRIGVFYQTIAEEHALFLNAQKTDPFWLTDKEYMKLLNNYQSNCEALQKWIEETVDDFRIGMLNPSDDW